MWAGPHAAESIEWFIKGQASSWSYDFAPPPPSPLDPRHTCRKAEKERQLAHVQGVCEEPNHTTVRKPNPLYLYFIIQSSLSHLLFIFFVSILYILYSMYHAAYWMQAGRCIKANYAYNCNSCVWYDKKTVYFNLVVPEQFFCVAVRGYTDLFFAEWSDSIWQQEACNQGNIL